MQTNATITTQQNILAQTSSINNLSLYLESFDSDNLSIKQLIKSQLVVLRYVNSPTLTDTVLSNVIFCLKDSLRYIDTEYDKRTMQEKYSLVITSYVFMMEARLQSEIKIFNEDARDLFKEGALLLADSIADVIKAQTGQVNDSIKDSIYDTIISNTRNRSFVGRVIDHIFKKKELKKKKDNFYKTLYYCFKTLGRHQAIIGKSMLISDLVRRYIEAINEHYMGRINENNVGRLIITLIAIGSSLIAALIRWIIMLIFDMSSEGWFTNHMIITGIASCLCWSEYLFRVIRLKLKVLKLHIISRKFFDI